MIRTPRVLDDGFETACVSMRHIRFVIYVRGDTGNESDYDDVDVGYVKVSGTQIFWIMFSFVVGMTMTILTATITLAKQDVWMSIIIGGAIGVGITFGVTKLNQLYPGQTLMQYSQTILGKWLGRLATIPYLVFWCSMTGSVANYSCYFVHLALFNQTPIQIIIIMMLVPVVYVVYTGGIEAIARCSEVLGPLIMLMIAATLVLNLNNLDWHQLLPVYADSGWHAILKSTLSPVSLFGEPIIMMMIVPFMSQPQQAPAKATLGVAVSILFICATTLMVIGTLGPTIPARQWFPFYDLVRFINVMDFIQNVDTLMVVIWISSVFIKLSLGFFVTCYGTAQWLGVQNWKKLIWPMSVVVLTSTMIPQNIVSSLNYNPKFHVPFVLPITYIIVPFLLWCIGIIRKNSAKASTRSNEHSGNALSTGSVSMKPWTVIGSIILLTTYVPFCYWWAVGFPSPLSHVAQ